MDTGDQRAARLAAALRDNLRKRKAQARAAPPDDLSMALRPEPDGDTAPATEPAR